MDLVGLTALYDGQCSDCLFLLVLDLCVRLLIGSIRHGVCVVYRNGYVAMFAIEYRGKAGDVYVCVILLTLRKLA